MYSSPYRIPIFISIALCFYILLVIIRYSPQEIMRQSSTHFKSTNRFRIIDLPSVESKQKNQKREERRSRIAEHRNEPAMSQHPLTVMYNKEAGDPKAVPTIVYHKRYEYKPYVLPPPIRLPSMTFNPFTKTSEYYRHLKKPSYSCNEDICRNPVNYVNQYAKWDCTRHPSLCSDPNQFLVMFEPKYRVGDVDIIENGIIEKNYDCGWPANHETSLLEPGTPYGHFAGSLVFLNVPQGFCFQHFVDGTLPKLVQMQDLIKDHSNIIYALDHSFVDQLPRQILARLGIPANRIVDYQSLPWINNRLKADKLYLSCRVPPLHPELWMRAQEMLKLPWLEKDWVQKKHVILYFSRNMNTRNQERRVINEEAIIETIQSFANSNNFEFLVFNANNYPNLDDLLEFMANVDIVIGPHGGAFYNILFMRRDVKVIELMPDAPTFLSLNMAVHLIIYLQSNLLGNYYYNIQGKTSGLFDMTIDPAALSSVLADCI